jgi:hypothetical protein
MTVKLVADIDADMSPLAPMFGDAECETPRFGFLPEVSDEAISLVHSSRTVTMSRSHKNARISSPVQQQARR